MKVSEFAIEVSGLTKRFATLTAVNELSLRVRRGEMFALVGPDGAGKTTFIRMLCGIVKPDSGTATVLGLSLANELASIKHRIGYLSQRFSLYPDLTVDENIEFFAEIHEVGEYIARRDELLSFTRLTPFRNRLADKLSGGMKQKLALACTLIHKPEVIFLDEPTTGVDPVSRREFWKILAALLKEGITIVMATPYLDEAERATTVALMNDGTLMALDSPQQIKRSMKSRIIEVVANDVRRAYRILQRSPEVLEVQAFGDRLNLILFSDTANEDQLAEWLRGEEIEVVSVRQIQPSLENVFISMMPKSAPLENA